MLFCVLTAHNNDEKIFNLINDLKNQTFKNFFCFLIFSSSDRIYVEKVINTPLNWLGWLEDENYNDFGHEKRAKGLAISNKKYTCFFNCDDRYSNIYFEKLITKAEKENLDLVFCNEGGKWKINTSPKIGAISSGGFIVKTSFAKKVGYNYRNYTADGKFVEDLVKNGAKWGKINEFLWEHY